MDNVAGDGGVGVGDSDGVCADIGGLGLRDREGWGLSAGDDGAAAGWAVGERRCAFAPLIGCIDGGGGDSEDCVGRGAGVGGFAA